MRPLVLLTGLLLSGLLLCLLPVLLFGQDSEWNAVCMRGQSQGRCDRFGPSFGTPLPTNTPTHTPTNTHTPTPTATPVMAFVVNSTDDDVDASNVDGICETATPGECTLRAAVMQHLIDDTQQTIGFSIPTAAPHTITLGSTLGTAGELTIDCGTEPGSSTEGLIRSGATLTFGIKLVAGSAGFDLIESPPGGLLVLKGCEISGFDSGQGAFRLDVADDALLNSYVHDNVGDGVYASDGVRLHVANSIITNNTANGIALGQGASDFLIEGNYIGMAPNGTTQAANDIGIFVQGGDDGTITNNIVSGNTTTGISISADGGDPASNNIVTNNLIGVDKNGAETACNKLIDGGVATVKTDNTICTGCCTFTNVPPNGINGTCIDTINVPSLPPTGIDSQGVCDAFAGFLGEATGQNFNPNVNCSVVGDQTSTCATP